MFCIVAHQVTQARAESLVRKIEREEKKLKALGGQGNGYKSVQAVQVYEYGSGFGRTTKLFNVIADKEE